MYASAILGVIKFAFPKQWEEDSRVPLWIKHLQRGVSGLSPVVKVVIGWDISKSFHKLFYITCPESLFKAKLKSKIDILSKGFILLMLASGGRINDLIKVDRRKIKFEAVSGFYPGILLKGLSISLKPGTTSWCNSRLEDCKLVIINALIFAQSIG